MVALIAGLLKGRCARLLLTLTLTQKSYLIMTPKDMTLVLIVMVRSKFVLMALLFPQEVIVLFET